MEETEEGKITDELEEMVFEVDGKQATEKEKATIVTNFGIFFILI